MKWFVRWLFRSVAFVSAALLVATCVLWARSYWVRDSILWTYEVWHKRPPGSAPRHEDSLISTSNGRLLWYHMGRVTFSMAHGIPDPYVRYGFQLIYPEQAYTMKGYPPNVVRYSRRTPPDSFRSDHAIFLGFGIDRDAFLDERRVVLPLWMPAVVTSILPTVGVVVAIMGAKRRRRLAARTLCAKCGYDLRATPGRCPECGEVPAPEPEAAGTDARTDAN